MKIPAITITILAACQLCACAPGSGPVAGLAAPPAKRNAAIPARLTSAGRPAQPASLLILGVN